MSLLNGVRIIEAIESKTVLDSTNPLIGSDEMILSYDSISSGNYRGVRARVGPGYWNDLEDIFNNSGSAKIPKTGTMLFDYYFDYALTSGDIAQLGAEIGVTQVLINNISIPYIASYSNYPCSAGDIITLTGLPLKSTVTSLNFILQ